MAYRPGGCKESDRTEQLRTAQNTSHATELPYWLRGKESPAVQKTWKELWEDPLEKEMATRSNILAWKTTRAEKPGGQQSIVIESQA